jgi:predicted ATPase/DNA-binding SARP family transcriptional activator
MINGSIWTIQLLGGLAARSHDRLATRFRTQKAAALLAYLAFYTDPNRPPHPRETLIGLLWPDTDVDAGRHNLSNALSSLRHLLEPPGVPAGAVLAADRFTVRLHPAAVATDVALFEAAAHRAAQAGLPTAERLARLREAADRYQGALLPGFYDEWVLPEGTRLCSLYLQVVAQAVPLLLETSAAETALEYAQRAALADPLSEEAIAQVLRVQMSLGQPSRALRQYREFAERLREELDDEPSAELQALARELREAAPTAAEGVAAISTPPRRPQESPVPAQDVGRPWGPRSDTPAPRPERAEGTPRLRGDAFVLLTTTRFFDREEEMKQLAEMLQSPRTRLVTITGPGGTGKSRLALELAARLVQAPENAPALHAAAPKTATFVPLADVADASRIFDVILWALGLTPAPNRAPLDQVTEALAAQPETLLILDNVEHLVEEGAPLVRELLARVPAVKCLVTSRVKLLIEGEREFHLRPLPTAGGAQTPEELLASPSVRLFLDRAQAARPDFQLTAQNAAAIGELSDRLEGIPLALELAAARAQVLSPGQILEQISANRLDFLASRRRGAAARQRTLRATLDWSYLLLPERARRFLAQLSVFRGGWTLEAARAVCEADEEDEALELLSQLRDSSLITAGDEEEGLRFHLLETVREYAAEQLEGSGVREAVQRRHAAYFLELAEAAEAHLHGPDLGALVRRLDREHDNFRSALGWARAAGEDAFRAQLGFVLYPFWKFEGYVEEARQWLEDLWGKRDCLPLPCRADLLHTLGMFAHGRGDFEEAITLYRQSLPLYREVGDAVRTVRLLSNLGQLVRDRDPVLAQGYLEESLVLGREAGDGALLARTLLLLATERFREGDHHRSTALLAEARTVCRRRGDLHGLADLLVEEGEQAMSREDRPRARVCFDENLALRRQIGDRPGIGIALYWLGWLALADARFADAARDFEGALTAFRECQWGHTHMAAEALVILIAARRRLGDHAETETLAQHSLRILHANRIEGSPHRCLFFLADAAARRSELVRAARLLGILAALGVPLDEPEAEESAQLRASLIAQLGEARFTQEEQIGQALPEDEAMALALGEER